MKVLLQTALVLAIISGGAVYAAPLTPAQCTKAMQDCGNSKPCQEHLKKFNDCVTPTECSKAMKECKNDANCLEILKNNAGCGAD